VASKLIFLRIVRSFDSRSLTISLVFSSLFFPLTVKTALLAFPEISCLAEDIFSQQNSASPFITMVPFSKERFST
jgi:hypothetical protein